MDQLTPINIRNGSKDSNSFLRACNQAKKYRQVSSSKKGTMRFCYNEALQRSRSKSKNGIISLRNVEQTEKIEEVPEQ